MGQSQSHPNDTMASAHTSPAINRIQTVTATAVDTAEPADKPDRTVNKQTQQRTYYPEPTQDTDDLIDPNDTQGEHVPDSIIPATGRGNSEDGRKWLNPSANQLYRALKRKNKPIEKTDALQVATVHNAVTDNTWSAIQEYEALHSGRCQNVTLNKFQGMDGIYSFKAKIVSMLTGGTTLTNKQYKQVLTATCGTISKQCAGQLPFDRHDWYVDRCGTEVKYVIDYYSIEDTNPATGETDIAYYIDARPSPTVSGMFDRARLAVQKYRAGESVW